MGVTQILIYPFLFIAIFFESFVLVTFLSQPARSARRRVSDGKTPSVAIIVPCWNEASTISGTCESLLALEYPKDKLEIILVDDGSTDATPLAMAKFVNHPQVRVIRKENGGKHTALNAGIAVTNAEFIGCLDADSFVVPNALRELIPAFSRPSVAAVTAAMSVHKPGNIVQHMQNVEYTFGVTLRHALASVNGLYVTPGPFSFYRKSALEKVGLFRHGHQTEDMEMALRLQQAGYEIENASSAIVYTKSPNTVFKLVKQRTRWTTGFLRNIFGEYRNLIWSRKNQALGMLVLPLGIMAIASGMLLFAVMLFTLVRNIVLAIEIRAGIPFSYSLLPHASFDWFYIPSSYYFLLIPLLILFSFTLIVIGKRISNHAEKIGPGLLPYFLLYGFVAPLWLLRATADVTFGKHRRWRE